MAQFWRKTDIVNDTGVFQSFPDLFIGQQDTIDIMGGATSRRAILEFKVAESPTFGGAKITAVRPNFYINSYNLNEATELPRYKGYVFKENLSDLSSAEGDLAIKDESAIVIHSVMDGAGTWLEDTFDGRPRQIQNDTVRLDVQDGVVSRILDEAIFVEDLLDFLMNEKNTDGKGRSDTSWANPLSWSVVDLAEYSGDFTEHINDGRESLRQWLITNYAIPADNATGFDQEKRDLGESVLGNVIAGAWLGGTAGALGGSAVPIIGTGIGLVSGMVAGAAGGIATTDHDAYVKQGDSFTIAGSKWIIPLRHKQKSGQRDVYHPKKYGSSPEWWILSGKIDNKVKRDVEIVSNIESEDDQSVRIHPGNTVFDIVRRQKNHWIADPESYEDTIEALYTKATFKPSAGYEGQGIELKSHWRNIDSAEVAEKGLMVPMSTDLGATPQDINNRQELMLSYGHIPRPNERDVYHAGAYDVDAQGAESAISSYNSFAGYESADETSRDTIIYEKMLDSKLATKVSFTTNLKDLEYAWAEARVALTDDEWADNGAARCPKNSQNGLISSRRGFFCTLSRNPVRTGKAGEQAQTFADYLIDNRTPIKDTNTEHTNIPGTFVLGFLNFPTDKTVTDNDPDNYTSGGAPIKTGNHTSMGDLGYIHKQRQNKISVVWHDYWDVDYGEGDSHAPTSSTTMNHSIGWEINEDFNEKYQSIEGLDSKGFYDIRWLGMANGPWDQPEERMVLLEPDTFYTIDMYMHPKVPFIRVHITNTATGKRVDDNKIQMWAGPFNVDSLQTIKAGTVTPTSPAITTSTAITGGTHTQVTTSTGAHKWFPKGSTIYKSDGTIIATVKSSTKTLITFEGKAAADLASGQTLYYWPGNHVNSRMGDESRWPAYCSFWLNNTPWKSDNSSATAFQGFEIVDDFDFSTRNGGTGDADTARGSSSTCFHIDMFTGNTHKQGTHTESTVLLDEFKIYNVNTKKEFATVSKNNTLSALGKLPVSSYSEVEALYRPIKNFLNDGNSHYIQKPDSNAAPFDNTGLTNIIVANQGAGYTEAPTVIFFHGSGTGAKATAVLGDDDDDDKVVEVNITDPGTGYTGWPSIGFLGGGDDITEQATARAYIGTSRLPTEIVKKIPAPHYTSIGFDSIPSDMYTLYGSVSGDSTVTKVVGLKSDYGTTSMMTFAASGTTGDNTNLNNIHKTTITSLAQTNPQTAEFSSTTDNELVGGKLKIHYNTVRKGDAGTTTAVRDIVTASNEAAAPYVEVWPPLPTEPAAGDDWEIQSRSSVLFNGLITNEVNNVDALTTPEFDFARPSNDTIIGEGGTNEHRVTRGIFNLGWAGDLSDITVGTSSGNIPSASVSQEGMGRDTKDGFNDSFGDVTDRTVTISGTGTSPKGGLECRYWDLDSDNTSSDRRQGMRVALGVNNTDAFLAPNGATKAIEVLRKWINNDDPKGFHQGPLGLTRTFDTQVDLTDCDIMVILRVPKTDEHDGNNGGLTSGAIGQIDGESDVGYANLQRNYPPPPTSGNIGTNNRSVLGLDDGPEYACSLRLYSGSQAAGDVAVGNWCLHKDNFMIKEEGAVYKPAGAKSPANGYWIKLVFPTAGTANLDKIKEFTFALNFVQHSTEDGSNYTHGSSAGQGGQRMHIAGIHAIPRGTADVMAAFSNSQNAVGELSKESFLSVQNDLHNLAKDGMHHVSTGMHGSAITANPKVTGLTIGGKGKLYTGYTLAGAETATDTTIATKENSGTSASNALKVDDRVSFGTSSEILRVKTVTSQSFTVERGADGTTATSHTEDAPIYVHTPSDANIVVKDYDYDVEGFSQKGFANFGFSANSGKLYNDSVTWERRENPLVATRIIEVIGYSEEGVRVSIDQPDIFDCENNTNTTWCIYRETPREAGVAIPQGQILNDLSTFTFKPSMLQENVLTLSKTNFLSNLPDDTSIIAPTKNYFISPYKYWIYLRYSPKARGNVGSSNIGGEFFSTDAPSFPKRSYKTLVRTENYFKGVQTQQLVANDGSTTANYTLSAKDVGPSWNESVFNDGKYLNPWSMDYGALKPIFEQGKDYGFGTFNAEDNIEGGQAFEDNVKVGWNEQILPNVVRNDNVVPGQKLSFMITPQHTEQNYDFSINSSENSNYKPYLLTTFWDELPKINFLTVQPDEETKTFPNFNWQVTDQADSWYGFIKIGTDAIYSQYHNKDIHIPMNETTTTALTVNDSTTNVIPSNVTVTREGLAGYAVDFNGTNSYIRYGAGLEDPTPNCTDNISLVAHIVPDSGASDNRYIISQEGTVSGDAEKFYIRLNSTNQVEARVWYSDTGYIDLTSGATVPTDGYTPSVIILTVDTKAREGNAKLYVNGKLEDQTGVASSSGSSDNWKLDTTLNTVGSTTTLTTGRDASQTAFTVGSTAGMVVGGYFQINDEIMKIVNVDNSTTLTGTLRAQRDTIAASHDAGDTITYLGPEQYLVIGNTYNYGNAFDGRLEEIVIYKDLIHPVDLSKGNYTLTKPLKELTTNGKRQTYNAVLFVKDYHNIRGEKPEDVAKSHQISFSKSSPAVTGV